MARKTVKRYGNTYIYEDGRLVQTIRGNSQKKGESGGQGQAVVNKVKKQTKPASSSNTTKTPTRLTTKDITSLTWSQATSNQGEKVIEQKRKEEQKKSTYSSHTKAINNELYNPAQKITYEITEEDEKKAQDAALNRYRGAFNWQRRQDPTSEKTKTAANEYINAAFSSSGRISDNFKAMSDEAREKSRDAKYSVDERMQYAAQADAYKQAAVAYKKQNQYDEQIAHNDFDYDMDENRDVYINKGKTADTYIPQTKEDKESVIAKSAIGSINEDDSIKAASLAMNKEERNRYYYVLGKKGEEAARNYLKALYDTTDLGQRYSQKMSQGLDKAAEAGKISDLTRQTFGVGTAFIEGLTSVGESFQGIGLSIQEAIDGEVGYNEMLSERLATKIVNNEREVTGNIGIDISRSIGQMLPVIAVSVATSGAGTPAVLGPILATGTTFATTYGTTYLDTRRQGYDAQDAASYSAIIGGLEAGLQYALSGVAKIEGGKFTKAISSKAGKAIDATIKNPIARKALNFTVTQGINSLGEYSEEHLQGFFEPLMRNVILNENNEVDVLSEDNFYQGAIGAFTAFLMNVPTTVSSSSQYLSNAQKIGKTIDPAKLMEQIQIAEPGTEAAKDAAFLLEHYGKEKILNGEVNPIEAGMLVLDNAKNAQKNADIKDYLDGKKTWNELSDTERAYIVDPKNSDFIAETFGVNVNSNMTPQEIANTIKSIAKNNQLSLGRQRYSDIVEDAETKSFYNKIEKVTGRQVFVERLGENINGYVTKDSIVINEKLANTIDGAKFVVAHELTHSVELTDSYKDVANATKDFFGEQFDSEVEARIKLYEENGVTLTKDEAEREVVADFVGNELFTDGEQLNRFVKERTSVARRIMSWIKEKLQSLTGKSHERTLLQNALKSFEKAFDEMSRSTEKPDVSAHSMISKKDADYMNAVNSGDTATQERFVKEVATQNGFKEEALHGTTQFGFTVADTSFSDDGISFFATDSVETAETYSATNKTKAISERNQTDTGIIEEAYNAKLQNFVETVNKVAGKNLITRVSVPVHTRLDAVKKGKDGGVEVANGRDSYIENLLNDVFYNTEAYDRYDTDSDFLRSSEARAIRNAAASLYATSQQLESAYKGNRGNYKLYVNTDGFLEVDAKGAKWNAIQFNGSETTTRDIAKYAKENGYKGVKITNLIDDGGVGSNRIQNPSTVYNFFDPQSQVKSADAVTYDDNGNVIPLSERFNEKKKDLRYSIKQQPKGVEGSSTNTPVDVHAEEIIDYMSGSKSWEEISDAAKNTLIDPKNADAISERTGIDINSDMTQAEILQKIDDFSNKNASVESNQVKKQESRNVTKKKLLKTLKSLEKGQKSVTGEKYKASVNDILNIIDNKRLYTRKSSKEKALTIANAIENFDKEHPNAPVDKTLLKTVNDYIGKKTVSELSDNELYTFYKLATHLDHVQKTENKIITHNKKLELDEFKAQTIADMHHAPKHSGNYIAQIYTLKSVNPTTFFNDLEGHTGNSWSLLADDLNSGTVKQETYINETSDIINETLDKFKRKDLQKMFGRNAVEHKVVLSDSKGNSVTLGLTSAEKIALYMNSLADDNMRHILGKQKVKDGEIVYEDGEGIIIPNHKLLRKGKKSEARSDGKNERLNLEQIESLQLTDAEMQIVNMLKAVYKKSQEAINETSVNDKGFEVATEDIYYPIVTDSATFIGEFSFDENGINPENASPLQARKEDATSAIVLTDALETMFKHVNQVAAYYGMNAPLKNLRAVFNDKGVQKEIRANYGHSEAPVDYIKNLVKDLGIGHKDISAFDKLRGNFAKSVLGLNPSVALSQTSAYPAAGIVLDQSSLVKGLGFNAFSKKNIDTIRKYSQLYRSREAGNTDIDIKNISDINKSKLKKGSNWIVQMDLLTVRQLWGACEAQVKKHNPELKPGTEDFYNKVAELHTEVIQKTQVNSSVMQLNPIQRSAAGRMIFMFRSEAFKNFNIIYNAYGELRASYKRYKADKSAENKSALKTARKKVAIATTTQLASAAMFAGIKAVIASAFDNEWEEEDEKGYFEKFKEQFGYNFLNSFSGNFIGGSEAIALTSRFTGIGYDNNFIQIPAIDNINSLMDSAAGFEVISRYVEGEAKPNEVYQAIKNFAKFAGNFAGVPVGTLEKYMSGIVGGISPEFKTWYENLNYGLDTSDIKYASSDEEAKLVTETMLKDISPQLAKTNAGKDIVDIITRNRNKEDFNISGAMIGDLKEATFNGEKIKFTKEEKNKAKNIANKKYKDYAGDLFTSKAYKGLSDKEKLEAYTYLADLAETEARNAILRDLGYKPKDSDLKNINIGDYVAYKIKTEGSINERTEMNVLLDMKIPQNSKKQIYEKEFGKFTDTMNDAVDAGMSVDETISATVAMKWINETSSNIKADQIDWILDNASTVGELRVLYENFVESESNYHNTLEYAEKQGVRPEAFIQREAELNGLADTTVYSVEDDLVYKNSELTTQNKFSGTSDNTKKNKAQLLVDGDYTDDELRFFWQKEYPSDDDFSIAQAIGLSPREYISYYAAQKSNPKKEDVFGVVDSLFSGSENIAMKMFANNTYAYTKDEQKQVVQLILNQPMTQNMRIKVLNKLGFVVDGNGNIDRKKS